MTEPRGSQKIVVGIDGSASSIRALQWGVRQAQLTGSVLEAVMVWQHPRGAVPAVRNDLDLQAESRRALNGAIAGAFPGTPPVPLTRVVEEGESGPTLVRRSTDAALLIIGSRGRGPFVGMLIGSVSEYCVTHAHCPVVVLRELDG